MSKYSGKCDLADWIDGYEDRDPEFYKKIKLYVREKDGEKLVPLNSAKDLIPYYPFIIGYGNGHSDGSMSLCIGSKSYITQEEERYFEWEKDQMVKYYNYCKRKKIAYEVSDAIDYVLYGQDKADVRYREELEPLARAVGQKGKKASCEGMRRVSSGVGSYYRNEWKTALIEAGWTESEADAWILEH